MLNFYLVGSLSHVSAVEEPKTKPLCVKMDKKKINQPKLLFM